MRRLTILVAVITAVCAAVVVLARKRELGLSLELESDATGDLSSEPYVAITPDGRVIDVADLPEIDGGPFGHGAISGDDANEDWLLDAVIASVISDHPDKAAAYRAGKAHALGFLLGQVMRAVDGRADVIEVSRRLRGQLDAFGDRSDPAALIAPAPIGERRARRSIADGDGDWENPILPGELPGRSSKLERPTDEEVADDGVEAEPAALKRKRASRAKKAD